MTRIACVATGSLLQARALGLSEGERLQLEAHLSSCDACSEDADRLATITSLLATPRPMRAAARERAIAKALRNARPGAARATRVVRWWTLPAAASLAAAAAVLLALVAMALLRRGAPPPEAANASPHPAFDVAAFGDAQMLTGEARVADAPLAPGAAWVAGSELHAVGPTKLAVAHAMVTLDADSTARWDATTSTLSLSRGAAEIEVDPAPKRPFRVDTDALAVEVLGTGFRVETERVSVSHGRVRVLDRASGRRAEVGAGESFTIDRAPLGELQRVTAPSASTPPSAAPGDSRSTASPSSAGSPSATAKDARRGAEMLAEARRHLAAGRAGDAESTVQRALGMPLSASDRAEARTLLAECAHARGDEAEAAKRYADVAGDFAQLPAGETALFAAARAEERAGRREAAAELLRRYLATYPDGRFRREAVARLRTLADPKPRSSR